jgi:hypothetical protein
VLAVGEAVPSATVFLGPGESASVAELGEGRPALLVFYLLDWSST